MSAFVWPDWHHHIPDASIALCRSIGVQPFTLPRAYFFGPEPAPVIIAPAVTPLSSLSDDEFQAVKGCFPSQSARKNGVDPRRVLDALLYLRTTRTRWTNMPKRYGSTGGIRKVAERWATIGVWAEFLAKLPELKLMPERARMLASIAQEWQRRGERYAAARDRRS